MVSEKSLFKHGIVQGKHIFDRNKKHVHMKINLGTPLNGLHEMVLMSIHNSCLVQK